MQVATYLGIGMCFLYVHLALLLLAKRLIALGTEVHIFQFIQRLVQFLLSLRYFFVHARHGVLHLIAVVVEGFIARRVEDVLVYGLVHGLWHGAFEGQLHNRVWEVGYVVYYACVSHL